MGRPGGRSAWTRQNMLDFESDLYPLHRNTDPTTSQEG